MKNPHLFSNLNCDSKDSFKEIFSNAESLSENTNHEVKIIREDCQSLVLHGEDQNSTFIMGNANQQVIGVDNEANGVTISGFTISEEMFKIG